MIEADIWRALIAVLRAGLDAQGYPGIAIKQTYQPKKQGVNSQDTVYLYKITSRRASHQAKKFVYNLANNNFEGEEGYWLEGLFQLTPQIERDTVDEDSITSYDIADLCAAILQTETAIKQLLESGIGIYRITDVRNPYSIDDYDQFDQESNFDFTLVYRQVIRSIVPVADPIILDIHRV